MFSSTSYPSNNPGSHQSQDHGRGGLNQSHSQPFTVAGMNSSSISHSPSIRSGPLAGASNYSMGGPLGDSLSQSRSHYQPGYLMSATPNHATSQSPRSDETPIVPTKAKISSVLSGGGAADFGMDSMFQSARQRQRATLADEDAPPTNSVNDLMNDIYDPAPKRQTQGFSIDSPARSQLFRQTQTQTPGASKPSTPANNLSKPLWVIVFGYPLDRYSVTVEYFRSLGETTEPEQLAEIINCFRVGYKNPAEAMRAVRKNGEVLSGAWMVGVKWADPVQAEAALGSSLVRNTLPMSTSMPDPSASPEVTMSDSTSSHGFPAAESSLALTTVPSVGTPLKLAPSTSAFRKPGSGAPLHHMGEGTHGMVGGLPSQPGGIRVQQSPSKGLLGQMSDLVFGW